MFVKDLKDVLNGFRDDQQVVVYNEANEELFLLKGEIFDDGPQVRFTIKKVQTIEGFSPDFSSCDGIPVKDLDIFTPIKNENDPGNFNFDMEELREALSHPSNILYVLDDLRKQPFYNTPLGKAIEKVLLQGAISENEIAEALEISNEDLEHQVNGMVKSGILKENRDFVKREII